MHSVYANGITIRTLRNGDTGTVAAVFGRLSDESRRQRFGGPKPRLSTDELDLLARVDATHHVLVAHVDGDPEPAGLARLVRIGRRSAEVAFEVAVELQATVTGSHRAVASLLGRSTRRLRSTWAAGECRVVAVLD